VDKIIEEAEVLRPLVEECLDDDPAVRPTMAIVCERIQVNKDAYVKECPQDVITLHQQLTQKEDEITQLRDENEQQNIIITQQRATIEQMVISY